MKVPFADLQPQYQEIKDEIDAVLKDVIANNWFIGGKPVKEFEQALTKSACRKHACGVANGTAAIAITLRALKLGPQDEVITTVHTAIPTAEAIVLAGAQVVFCDIEPTSYDIDPAAIEAAITPRTKALLPVHLYGMPANLKAIQAIAEKHKLALIEDCAQAQGAAYDGKPVGTFGLAGCLSFFPSKNLGGWGDGGAVVTDDAAIDRYVRMYSNHGREDKYLHEFLGTNERLDALQAAVLNQKLKKLDDWNARRRTVAGWYEEMLKDVPGLTLPATTPGATPIWHLYVVLVEKRDAFMKFLKEHDVSTGLHYPMALHEQPAFAHLRLGKGAFPVAEKVTSECVSLPMYPHMNREQVEYVCQQIRAYFKG
jgi:dTDP-4-amino-4,6-dideoxygalactose transaminase